MNVKKLKAEGDPHGRLRLKAYTPCACAEECGAECPCQQAPTLCEKYCACPKSCQFKAVGCKCTSACTTRACPCLASDRECDPDLCHG
jgi:histone-lysine N-methyltransferase EZH2